MRQFGSENLVGGAFSFIYFYFEIYQDVNHENYLKLMKLMPFAYMGCDVNSATSTSKSSLCGRKSLGNWVLEVWRLVCPLLEASKFNLLFSKTTTYLNLCPTDLPTCENCAWPTSFLQEKELKQPIPIQMKGLHYPTYFESYQNLNVIVCTNFEASQILLRTLDLWVLKDLAKLIM